MPIEIITPVFEGPLDLLLELIEKRKLLINDIALATVTDDYLARVGEMDGLPVGEVAEFVALAATLLLIKSRSLLPTLAISDDESRDIKQLQYRLAVYQIIKEVGGTLGHAWGRAPLYKGGSSEPDALFVFDDSITLAAVRAAAQTLIDGFPALAALPSTSVKKIVSLEDAIQLLAARVSSAFQLSFREFSGQGSVASTEARHSIIVSFLALLELVKQGIIKAHQGEDFGDITLEQDAVSTPRYE